MSSLAEGVKFKIWTAHFVFPNVVTAGCFCCEKPTAQWIPLYITVCSWSTFSELLAFFTCDRPCIWHIISSGTIGVVQYVKRTKGIFWVRMRTNNLCQIIWIKIVCFCECFLLVNSYYCLDRETSGQTDRETDSPYLLGNTKEMKENIITTIIRICLPCSICCFFYLKG